MLCNCEEHAAILPLGPIEHKGALLMKSTMTRLVVAGAMLLAGTAWAHHNMSGVYDFNDRVTLTGTLTKIDWRNPHIELVVDAKRDSGQVESWKGEGPAPIFFRSRDTEKADFEKA